MTDIFAAPPVAQSRNWKAYGFTALAGVGVLGTFVWFAVTQTGDDADAADVVATAPAAMSSFPDRKFEPPAKPAPAPVAAPPVQLLPPPAVIAAEVKAVPPLPPPPMASMFASGADDAAISFYSQGSASGGGGSGPRQEYRPGMTDGVDSLDRDQRQGLSAQKNQWLATAGTGGDDYVLTPKMPAISRYMLQAGTIIGATTLNAVNTDIPGDVVALINRDVLDTPTGTVVLIPASSKLYGRLSTQLSYGQRRAQIAWVRILWPDGSSQNIGSMAGTDEAGSAGVEGDVDRHVGGMALAVAGAGFFSMLSQAGQFFAGDDGDTTIVSMGTNGAGGMAQGIGSQIIGKELNRPNTLTVPAGTSVAVMLSKDVGLPPYVSGVGR